MVRRALCLLLPTSAAFLLSACSGADAQRATELLAQSQAAQAGIRSATYDARLSISQGSKTYTLVMTGGGYLKGPRAGDQVLSMQGEGLPVPLNVGLVMSRGRAFVRANGAWQSFALPSGQTNDTSSNWAGLSGQLTRYVKDVDVRENQVVAGERGTMVAGVVDTAGALKALSGLDAFSRATGGAAPIFDEVRKRFSDMRVVLFISSRTHLVRSMVINLEIKLDDGTAKIQMLYSLRSVNQPVSIPNL